MKKSPLAHIICIFTGVMIVLPPPVLALQSHGAPEGIYVHQMGHLLFSGSLAFLYWHTKKFAPIASKGWRYLQLFCLLLIAWNILALVGHEAFKQLAPQDFLYQGTLREQLGPPITFIKVLYAITKMDHLLNVPALLALLISLRTFYYEALQETREGEK